MIAAIILTTSCARYGVQLLALLPILTGTLTPN